MVPVEESLSHIGKELPSIVLVGIMGSGKTTIGRKVSRSLEIPFIDTDSMIEEEEGMLISDIFAAHGEAYFRDLETALLKRLAEKKEERVISTGGGIVIRPENRALLRELGYVVWLNASVEILFNRISKHTHRPLLYTEDPKGTLSNLLDQRTPWYREAAHLSIDSSNLTIPEILTGIVESLRVYYHQRNDSPQGDA